MEINYKPILEYQAMPWHYRIIWSDDIEKPWTVKIQELPGCRAHGKTPQEAFANAPEAIESYILSLQVAGEPVPPVSDDPYEEDPDAEPFDFQKWLEDNEGIEDQHDMDEYRIAQSIIGYHYMILWGEKEKNWTYQWSPPIETPTIESLKSEWDKATHAFEKPVIPYEDLAKCSDRSCSCWYENRVLEKGRKQERKRILDNLETLLESDKNMEFLRSGILTLSRELKLLGY